MYKTIDITWLMHKLSCMKKIVIVGAGRQGEKIARRLSHKAVKLLYFFDNNPILNGKSMYYIPIVKPRNLMDSDVFYIIATWEQYRSELCNQLLSLGIDESRIVVLDQYQDAFKYNSTLRPDEYKDAISDHFYMVRGRELNWENPTTYNEWINWEKINDCTPLKTRLADKYLVKDWVKEKIGEEYVAKLYGVWDRPEDIDFESLPEQFVLKVNHSSDCVIVVKNKSDLDREEAVNKLAKWLDYDLSLLVLERHYANIPRKVICEEYLPGVAESSYDYKVYCFHGQAEYIECISGCNTPQQKARFFSTSWESQSFKFAYPLDEDIAPRPNNLEKMLLFSNKLSEGFSHVRVDWYDLNDGRLVFGEMTFSSWGGIYSFTPEEMDEEWGQLIRNGGR